MNANGAPVVRVRDGAVTISFDQYLHYQQLMLAHDPAPPHAPMPATCGYLRCPVCRPAGAVQP